MNARQFLVWLTAGSLAMLCSIVFLNSGARASPSPFSFLESRPASTGLNLSAGGLQVLDETAAEIVAVDDWDSTDEDVPKDTEVTANDILPSGNISLSVVNSPSNGSAIPKNKFIVTYTPNTNYIGTDNYRYRICDNADVNGSCSEADVTIVVNAVNDPPIAEGDAATTNEETPVAIAVLENDHDAENNLIFLEDFSSTSQHGGSVTHDPANLLDTKDDLLVYTPPANFNGIDTFSYTISDGTSQGSAIVTVTVQPVNDPPTAASDSYTATQDIILDVPAFSGVLVNDSDPDGDPLTAVWESGPLNGSVDLHPDGGFGYTPNAGFTGQDSFAYHASDGQLPSNSTTVTIQVQENNAAPVANGDSYSVQVNGTLTVSAPGVLNNDTDADGDLLSAIRNEQDQTEHGTLVFNTEGSFTYIPDDDFLGEDKFTYWASDGQVISNQAEVVINVSPSDTQQPSVTWTSPVSDQDVHTVTNQIIVLEVQASDNQAVDRVLFYRWDAIHETYMDLATVTAPPYRLELDTGTLNLGWNQISARAYDNVGNPSQVGYIWLYRVMEFFLPVASR